MLARLFAQRMTESLGQTVRGRERRRRRRRARRRSGRQGGARRPHAAVPQHHLHDDDHDLSARQESRVTTSRRTSCRSRSAPMCRSGCWRIRRCRPTTSRSSSAWAKQTKDKLNYGSTGPGSIMNLMGEVLKRDGGIQMQHVPFRGAAPLVTEMLSGRIQFGGDQLSSSLQHVRSGALKAMAVATPSAAMPNVPTVRSARLPESRAAGLERLPRAQGHAGAGGRAPAPGDRGGEQASRRAQAHDRGRRRAVRLDARRDARHASATRSPR